MKSGWICFGCFATALCFVAAQLHGQELPRDVTDQESAEQPQEVDFARLPPPLSTITGNLLDLEKSGHLRVIDATYGRTKLFDDRAVIWTVEVVEPLTCGHAILLLKRVSDVRFYHESEDYERRVFYTRLFYESWLDAGAVSHKILDRDERFSIWIDLKESEAWMLNHEEANKVVFENPGQRHKVQPDFFTWK
jgi:hypothetical protein